VAELLRNCRLFSGLDQAGLETLAAHAGRRKYSAGSPVFHAGDAGDSLMGILSGEVRISRPTRDGDDIILADFGPGEVLGEIAVLDGKGRSADAMAIATTELIILERADLFAFLAQRPEFYSRLIAMLCEKIRRADERTTDFAFLDLKSRLAKALLSRSSPDRAAGRIALTQTELARIVGGTRSNVNRLMKAWERDCVIRMDKGWIELRDRPALALTAVPPT